MNRPVVFFCLVLAYLGFCANIISVVNAQADAQANYLGFCLILLRYTSVQMPEISTGHHSPESAQELGLKIKAHKVRWDHYQLTAVNRAALNYAGLV